MMPDWERNMLLGRHRGCDVCFVISACLTELRAGIQDRVAVCHTSS